MCSVGTNEYERPRRREVAAPADHEEEESLLEETSVRPARLGKAVGAEGAASVGVRPWRPADT